MKESVLPKKFKIFLDQIQWVNQGNTLFHSPQLVRLAAHLLKNVSDNFFFVGKVKIEISGADIQLFGYVIGGHGHNTTSVKQIDRM